MLTNVLRDRLTTNFFLTFDDELDLQRQLAIVPFHQGFDSFDFHPELAFVVHGSSGIDIVVTLGWFERRCDPLVERIRGLNVIVCVAQHGRLAGSVQPIGVNQRVTLGRNDFNMFHPNASEFTGDKLSRLLHVRFVFL